MFVRAYLRASTIDQDASRARASLESFAEEHGVTIANFYEENESGTKLERPELFRLLNDCRPGDILLTEQVDRLSRLTDTDWKKLRGLINEKGVTVVALDLPTSHQLLTPRKPTLSPGGCLPQSMTCCSICWRQSPGKTTKTEGAELPKEGKKPKLTVCIKDAPSIKRNIAASMNYWPKASPSARLQTS